jgi:N-methylhydantoinase A
VPGPRPVGLLHKGGQAATFTDAALIISYLDPHNFLGGEIALDPVLAQQAIDGLVGPLKMSREEAAAGIVRISEAKIAGAVRVISIEQGHHPKDFALLAFGGGGGFVVANVARELGIPVAIVPIGPANFSALGMLMVDVVHDFAQTYVAGLQGVDIKTVNEIYAHLSQLAHAALSDDGFNEKQRDFVFSAELRYVGQEHTVNLRMPDHKLKAGEVQSVIENFSAAHRVQYGHSMDDPVEIVTLRLRGLGLLPKPKIPQIGKGSGQPDKARKGHRPVYLRERNKRMDYPVYDRSLLFSSDRVEGPAIIEEPTSTTIIHAGDVLKVGEYGELIIDIG